MYITFDGTDFAGKTTVINLVVEMLNAVEKKTEVFPEPGTGPYGQFIRNVVLSDDAKNLNRLTIALLFTSAYNETINNYIKPALALGRIVIGDRSNISTFAYQYKLKSEQLHSIFHLTRDQIQPDLSFCLVTSYEEFKHRMENSGREIDAWDKKSRVQHDALVGRFNLYTREHPDNTFLINTDELTPEDVAKFIFETIMLKMKA